jgi:hypothetical protein
MKIAINRCFGGFSLSKKAYEFLELEWDGCGYAYVDNDKRTDPKLIEMIECLGSEEASGRCSELKVIEIPYDVDWVIKEYDGIEHIAEVHKTWS